MSDEGYPEVEIADSRPDKTGELPKSTTKRKPAREFFKLAVYAVVAYVAFGIIMHSPLYTAIVLRPDSSASPLYQIDKILDAPRQEFSFESRGNKLHGWYFARPGAKVLVVVHHGNAGNLLNRLFLARTLISSGASVVLYDYSGYGKSSGEPCINGLLEDGLAAFDYASKSFPAPYIVNYGESIGSAVACNVDENRHADGLILQSGITSLPDVAKDGVSLLKLYPQFLWPEPVLDNCTVISKSKTPLLIVHGEKDTMVPSTQGQRLYQCAASTKKAIKLLPNCGHNDVGNNDAVLFQQAIEEFVGNFQAGGG